MVKGVTAWVIVSVNLANRTDYHISLCVLSASFSVCFVFKNATGTTKLKSLIRH